MLNMSSVAPVGRPIKEIGRPIGSRDVSGSDDDSGTVVDTDNPSARILRTVECLATDGPMTLDQLSERLGVSKSAVWRVVGHLREAGWVQLKQGNRLIELHYRIDELFSRASFSDEEFAGIRDMLEDVPSEFAVHIDLFALTHNDGIEMIDTTRRWRGDQSVLMEALDEDVVLVMRSVMTDSMLARHLATWDAEGPAQKQAQSVRASRSVRPMTTVRWTNATQSLTVAVRGLKGTPGALRISGRRRKLQRAQASDIMARLRDMLDGLIEFMEP